MKKSVKKQIIKGTLKIMMIKFSPDLKMNPKKLTPWCKCEFTSNV